MDCLASQLGLIKCLNVTDVDIIPAKKELDNLAWKNGPEKLYRAHPESRRSQGHFGGDHGCDQKSDRF